MLENSKNDYFVRDYTLGDYKDIIPLWISLDLGRPERGDNEKIIKETLNNGGKLLILEEKKTKKIIGTSWITNDKRRLYLHHFGIDKNYQGKGLSKFLLEESLNFAKELGLQIKLEVHESNSIAIDLYKKYGFKYLGDYEVYIIRDY